MATLTSFDLNGSGTGLNESRTIQEGASAIRLAPSATLSASGNFNGQSLRLSGLLAESQIGFASGVSLSGTSVRVNGVTVGSVTGGLNGADFVIVFNSNATASRVQTVLRNLTYTDVSDAPTESQTITFNLAGTVRTDAITVIPVNDRPVLDLNGAASGTGSSATFIENRSVLVSPNATLTDPDTSSLVSLQATLLARPDGNALERLSLDTAAASAAAAAGLSVTYTASTGALSIVGSASMATYQAILRGILYENGSDQPSTATRTVRVLASDGVDTSLTRDGSVSITRVNDAPVLDLNGAAAGTGVTLSHRTGDPPTKVAGLATVADIDSANFGGGSLRVGFTENGSSGDQLRIMTDATVTIGGTTVRVDGTSIGTVSGGANGVDLVVSLNTNATPAAVQTLLQYIGFSTGTGSPTSPRQVAFTLNDGDGTANSGNAVASAVATIELTAGQGNVAPTLTGDLQATIANGSTYQFTTSDFFYTDPDDGPAGVTFGVSNLDNGYVLRNGSEVSNFTAEQLAAGQITFWHDGTEPVGSFRISVEDGNEDGSAPIAQNFVFNVTTAQVNAPPSLTGDLRATVASGGAYVLSQADLFYSDPDDSATGVVFTVSGIAGGTLLVTGAPATSFTPQQLSDGQVAFRHDGTSSAPSFSVSVEDGNEDGSGPVSREFLLTVGSSGGSALDLSGATRGVRADLGAAEWVLATKVMALGDSITNGDSPPGQDEHGYRGFFYQNVVEAGRLVDMVGPNSNGQVPDPHHAGYPGETGDDIQALLPSLLATYTPSAILLMAGTNDIFYKSNPQNAVQAEIAGMLDHVAQASPTTHVYVSLLIPLSGYETQVANVNAAIRSVVADAIGRGQNVSLVEMPSVTLSDLFDGIHPTDTGYREMAGYWTTAFLANPPAPGTGTAIDAAVTAVIGSPHNDLLIGDGRANEISGGAGADWIRGEGGNDLLGGGAGQDVFVFAPGFGQDAVRDFVRGEDVLDLRALALNVGDFASWRQDHISDSGADAIVTIEPGHSVTLTGVTATALQVNDFLFV